MKTIFCLALLLCGSSVLAQAKHTPTTEELLNLKYIGSPKMSPDGRLTVALHKAVSGIDPALPLDQVETMEQLVSVSVAQPRFRTVLLAVFSILALMMASIGVYGVMNYLVIQQTREFVIRLAVGATEGDVLWLVLGRGGAFSRPAR